MLCTADAAAAPPRAQDRGPTEGVDRLYHDYSSEGDASSLELNPAMLSAIHGLDLTLLGYRTVSAYTRGTGFGGFVAMNFFDAIALGLGVQGVEPRLGSPLADNEVVDFDRANNPPITKISFGVSGGRREYGALGVAVHGMHYRGHWLQRPDFDVGTMFKIFNYGAVGFSARLAPMDLAGTELPAEVQLAGEFAVRPLGTHHLEIAGGLKSRHFRGDLDLSNSSRAGVLPRARIAVRYQGWALKGEAEQVRAIPLGANDQPLDTDEKAWRGSVALEASWDFVTAGGGVHAGLSDGLDGFGYSVSAHTARQGRIVWPRRMDAERIALSDVTDERSMIGMLQRIERARRAGKRSILVVDARGTDAGWASLHELREALVRVRNTGGHVFAYVEAASLKDYYVASVAERIFIHPAGELDTFGMASSALYFKAALAKLGVRVEGLAIEEYKSAHERFTRDEPSEADREQRTELMKDLYAQVVHDVAQGRELTLNGVRALFDDAPHGPEQGVEHGLVDEVVFRDQLLEKISEDLGASVEFASFGDMSPEDRTWARHPYIAVVLVEGTIKDGKSLTIPFLDLKFAGGDTIADTLKKTQADPACRGVILRVNSPGGSALASDIIWRQTQLIQKANEEDSRHNPPIVVSMGDVAASGGYYVSMGTDHVLADPATITGSIGVVSMHFDVSGLLRKLGISAHTIKEGKNPDMGELWRPYTADQKQRIEASMRRTYDLFRRRVSDARELSMEKVDELGRGHVYSGTDAKALGLVDQLGGLHEAIAVVRQRAGIAPRRELELRVLPRRQTILDLLFSALGRSFQDDDAPLRKGARRRSKSKEALPLALDKELARLPLSILYLPQDRASLIMPGQIEIE